MILLGLNAYHGDASACLLRDGVLVVAAEEERFRRIKHWAGFPSEAIRYCLREAGLKLGDVSHVAVNQDGRANLLQKLGYLVTRRPDLGLVLDRIRNKRKRAGVDAELEACFPGERFAGSVHEVEHHLAHLMRLRRLCWKRRRSRGEPRSLPGRGAVSCTGNEGYFGRYASTCESDLVLCK